MFKEGFGHLVRAEGFQGCVMKQHGLMKQQTIIQPARSSVLSLGCFLELSTSSRLQARAVKRGTKLLFLYRGVKSQAGDGDAGSGAQA